MLWLGPLQGINRWEATLVQNDVKWISRKRSCHLPVWVNGATDRTWLKRNNSNPRVLLIRLNNTDILENEQHTVKTAEKLRPRSGRVENPKKKRTQKNGLRAGGELVVGFPASCEPQHPNPASVGEQLDIFWAKRENNPNAEKQTKNQDEESAARPRFWINPVTWGPTAVLPSRKWKGRDH